MKTLLLPLLAPFLLSTVIHAGLDPAKIESLTGLKGTANEAEGTFKVTAPRTDVKIAVDGWTMPPFMGLTTWAAFKPGVKVEAMCAGDLVVFEDEINPVMSAALEAQKKVRAAAPVPQRLFGAAFAPEKNAITAAPLDVALGVKGQSKDGMYKAVIGRTTKLPCGCEMGKEMGVNTWAAFAGTDDNAVVCGDFCVLGSELLPVLKSLRKEGINIVAIHHHMTMEEPRYLFLHYWGKGTAAKLGGALRATLTTQSK